MHLRTGLNPYGISYHLGLHARGTARANPNPVGLEGFLKLTEDAGGNVIELADSWLQDLDAAGLRTLRARLEAAGVVPVISSGLHNGDVDACIRHAQLLGADRMRFALTPILCGDRAAAGERWHVLVSSTREKLAMAAPKAAAAGLTILIENHQDFTSHELVALCHEFGPAIRIVYDTANSFPVAEAPLDFTRVVAPYVRYVHAKDYRVQFTTEGIRLVRCATGDGAVPFKALFAILAEHHETMLAAIEIGALEARHVRLFTPGWWQGYRPKEASALAACLLAAQTNRLAEDDDWRTPWERNADGEIAAYELAQMQRSIANMKSLGLM